ncbi:MAG: uroporphyrinogen-III C-methyltransferase [Cytophagaceae bacterium BCCC1]|nr:MAG: uroporphyrinogen-III C-methyltransferase [Cytophagaceae bacterium BCCC1]
MKPKITLVGAGPGDAELITLKGIKALEKADVVLYDALANEEILKYTQKDCKHIFVGKRFENHSLTQDQINELLITSAFEYGHAVRLKGGDPIVFGRATEELEYAETFGIETEVISGVSSCIAVPTAQGIPVTKRGLSESFWVMTGHTKAKELPKDIFLAAQSSATIVILMGLSKLEEIAEIFTTYGKSETPVAIIQNGTCHNERFVIGKIKDVAAKVREENIKLPSVIIIGEVVSVHKEYILEYGSEILCG